MYNIILFTNHLIILLNIAYTFSKKIYLRVLNWFSKTYFCGKKRCRPFIGGE